MSVVHFYASFDIVINTYWLCSSAETLINQANRVTDLLLLWGSLSS